MSGSSQRDSSSRYRDAIYNQLPEGALAHESASERDRLVGVTTITHYHLKYKKADGSGLTPNAKHVYSILAINADRTRWSIRKLARERGRGLWSTRAGVRELEAEGFLLRVALYGKRHFFDGMEYVLTKEPILKGIDPKAVYTDSAKPSAAREAGALSEKAKRAHAEWASATQGFKKQIDYDALRDQHLANDGYAAMQTLDSLVHAVVEYRLHKGIDVRYKNLIFPRENVLAAYRSVTAGDIQFTVRHYLNEGNAKNPKAYLRTMLYNDFIDSGTRGDGPDPYGEGG